MHIKLLVLSKIRSCLLDVKMAAGLQISTAFIILAVHFAIGDIVLTNKQPVLLSARGYGEYAEHAIAYTPFLRFAEIMFLFKGLKNFLSSG
jgi:hypothetical protein